MPHIIPKGLYEAWKDARRLVQYNKDYGGRRIRVGIGIHDSSAALLSYIRCDRKPFVLVSTGTWSIALNPFNEQLLTTSELKTIA